MSEIQFQWPIVGHKNIVEYLQQSILNNRVAHAYLFFGPQNIGKATITQNLVGSLLCENLHHQSGLVPCHQCDCCHQVVNKIHPDIIWLEREFDKKTKKLKKNVSIEQIRELKSKLSLHSFLNAYKVAVINEAEHLSQEAANALLKTLEEPTPRTVIVLLTKSISVIPQTILSRCQVLKLLPVADSEISQHLINIGATKKSAKALTAAAYGRPGLAIDYFSNPELFEDQKQRIKEFLALVNAEIPEKFKLIQSRVGFSDVDSIQETLDTWTRAIRDLTLIKNANENLVNNIQLATEFENLATSFSNSHLNRVLKEINLAKRYLAANVNPRLILENLILNF